MLVGLSLVMTVLILHVHHRGDVNGKTVPSWVRRYLLQNPRNQCSLNKYDVDSMDSVSTESKNFSLVKFIFFFYFFFFHSDRT